MDIEVLADQRRKIKENEKKGKCLDLAKLLKYLKNMNVTVILVVIRALGTIPDG